ncbi:6143_t:CDS:2 [Ambispora gerdemannii]|uniref:6143_t:CDS:1 n=1 Tax=Ambispora gerdemannii TaxID=144530 RepID=A0A9N9DIZ5_9GLOM|nr:6143_t:CDS:2 [Ambispora gerdemannii]
MHTKLSVIFLLIFTILLLNSTQADEFKPPTIQDAANKYKINEPKAHQVYYNAQKKITLDYTFEDKLPNEIFLLDIYLLNKKGKKIKTFVKNANTTAGNHRFTRKFPENLHSGNYTVRFNETKNTGIYWSTAYLLTDIPIKYLCK